LSDDVEEDVVLETGPKYIDEPRYYIVPDYVPALTVLKWYFSMMNSLVPIDMPYVEKI